MTLLIFFLLFAFSCKKTHAKSQELSLEAVEMQIATIETCGEENGDRRWFICQTSFAGSFVKSWSCKKFLFQFLDSFLSVIYLHNLGSNRKKNCSIRVTCPHHIFHWFSSAEMWKKSGKIQKKRLSSSNVLLFLWGRGFQAIFQKPGNFSGRPPASIFETFCDANTTIFRWPPYWE